MSKYIFHLKGLTCANCAGKIEEKLKKTPGMINLNYDFLNDELTFESDKESKDLKIEIQEIVDSIEDGVTVTEDLNEAMRRINHYVFESREEETGDGIIE